MLRVQPDIALVRRHVVRLLGAQAEKLDRLGRRTHRSLDADRVHDLRVLLRRIRATVWTARQLAPIAPLRRLRRALRRLGRALGARRAQDVLLADAREFGLDASIAAAEREEAGRDVRRLLRPGRRASIRAMVRAARALVSESRRDRLAQGVAARARRLAEALARAPRGKREMHLLRIEAKKARYTLEILGRASDFLKPLQERLGRAHDLEVLQERLGTSDRAARDERRHRAAAARAMRRVVGRALEELAP